MSRLFSPLALAALLLGPVSPAALAAPEGATAAVSGANAMQGEWMILGPASMAHLPLMMEFTFQDADPTAEAMTAARLTPAQQQQVHDARRRAAANPTAPELVEMQAMWAALKEARMVIGADTLIARASGAEKVVRYAVVKQEGLQVFVRTTDPAGDTEDLIITLPGEGTLMMGPQGEEPIVLRRVR